MRHVFLKVKAEQPSQHGRAAVNIFRSWFGLFVELIAHIIDKRGFSKLPGGETHRVHARSARPPTHEMQQGIGIRRYRESLQSMYALRNEKTVGPLDLASLRIDKADRRLAGGKTIAADGLERHGRARSSRRRKSRALAPEAKKLAGSCPQGNLMRKASRPAWRS